MHAFYVVESERAVTVTSISYSLQIKNRTKTMVSPGGPDAEARRKMSTFEKKSYYGYVIVFWVLFFVLSACSYLGVI